MDGPMIMENIQDQEVIFPTRLGKYKYIRTLGAGGFSVVILVKKESTNEKFACKIVSRELLVKNGMLSNFEQETRILQTLNHPNIVKIEDIIYTDKLIYLIMELCERGELLDLIESTGTIYEHLIKKILSQIIDALEYLHARNIAHRDIKPENILITKSLDVKLADFGLCQTFHKGDMLHTPCGSTYYAPPEIILNRPYDGVKCDMWSLGVCLFSMAVGSLPWSETNTNKVIKQIITGDFIVPLSVSPPLRYLIKQLMSVNPSDRPNATQLKDYEFLKLSHKNTGVVKKAFSKRANIISPFDNITKSTAFNNKSNQKMVVRLENPNLSAYSMILPSEKFRRNTVKKTILEQ